VKRGSGLIKVNGAPINLLQPEILRLKTFEPILILGIDKFASVSSYFLVIILGHAIDLTAGCV
jgi:small subunit ribosomal protein S16e